MHGTGPLNTESTTNVNKETTPKSSIKQSSTPYLPNPRFASPTPMDAAGPPIDDDIVGSLPFSARRRGSRPASPSRVEHELTSQSHLTALSTGKAKGNVGPGAAYSGNMTGSSAEASSLGSQEGRKVKMDRRCGRRGDGMAKMAATKMVASMDMFTHKQ